MLRTLPPYIILSLAICAATAADSLTGIPADAVALLAFKMNADLDGRLPYNKSEKFDYCHWQGVKCAQGRVVRYGVQSSGLRGAVADATLSRLDQLRVLSLQNNSLSGPLPDFSTLSNLKSLFLNDNYFVGSFPPSLLFLHHLQALDLSHNNFTGFLPENLTALDRLVSLRLDSNMFSGPIPPLNQTALRLFNVSRNNLSGPVPVTSTLKKFRIFSFLYNPNLCGEIVHIPCRYSPFFNSTTAADADTLPSPPSPLLQNAQSQQGLSDSSSPSHKKLQNLGLVLFISTGMLILTVAILSVITLIRKRRTESVRREQIHHKVEPDFTAETTNAKSPAETSFFSLQVENSNSGVQEVKSIMQSPQQNGFSKSEHLIFCSGEEEAYTLDHLMRASAELLGRGSIGTTYKAVISNQITVSVKRLDACKTAITSGEAFEQHMEAVGMLRHPNLVPVRAYFQARQERLIIYDYQSNGSLFNLIHELIYRTKIGRKNHKKCTC